MPSRKSSSNLAFHSVILFSFSCWMKNYDLKIKVVSFFQVMTFGLAAVWMFGITLVCSIYFYDLLFL